VKATSLAKNKRKRSNSFGALNMNRKQFNFLYSEEADNFDIMIEKVDKQVGTLIC